MGRCHITREPNAPSSAPLASGDHFVNTANGDLYISNGTASVANWVLHTASVTDHGALTGLGDDDHTQYVLRNILTTKGDIFVRGASSIARLPIGTDGQKLEADSSEALGVKWVTQSGMGGNSNGYRVSFVSQDHEGIRAKQVSYTRLADIIFDGSTILGTPTKIKVLFTRKTGATGTLSIKIFDRTNSLTIVEKTGLSPTTDDVFEIGDLGTLANIPSGADNIWEIQALVSVTGGGEESYISYLQMEF